MSTLSAMVVIDMLPVVCACRQPRTDSLCLQKALLVLYPANLRIPNPACMLLSKEFPISPPLSPIHIPLLFSKKTKRAPSTARQSATLLKNAAYEPKHCPTIWKMITSSTTWARCWRLTEKEQQSRLLYYHCNYRGKTSNTQHDTTEIASIGLGWWQK